MINYRNKIIQGKCIDLVPYQKHHAESVVRLRNLPEVQYFMNQPFVSTIETQNEWYENYLKRDDDLFWVIQDKSGRIVGTNRLYDITAKRLEKGSQIADPAFRKASPIAIESDLLLMSIAFFSLKVDEVIYRTRYDNDKVESMNARFGFVQYDSEFIRGKEYRIYRLNKDDFHPEKLTLLVEYWSKRNEPR